MAFEEKVVVGRADHEEKVVVGRADHEEKEYCPQPDESALITLPSTANLPAVSDAYGYHPHIHAPQKERPPWRKKRLWLPIATLFLLAAIAGGTIGGVKSSSEPSSTAPGSTIPSNTASTPVSSSTAAGSAVHLNTASTPISTPTAAGSDTPSNAVSKPTSTPSAASAPFNSSLASIAWADSDGVGYRRLYYQDSAGTIKESAWNSSARKWYVSNEAMGIAKPKSPLAASVLNAPLYRPQVNLYFLNARGQLVERYTHDSQLWSSGEMSDANIVPSPNSDLAAIWTGYKGAPCNNCGIPSALLVYEDINDKLWVVNATSSGLRYTVIAADPIPGSGLAMNLAWRREGGPGLRLYYQKGAGGIISGDWEDWESGSGDWEWTLHEDAPLGKAFSGAPMATFSWGHDTDSGDPLLVDILNSGPQGVYLTWWTPQGSQEPAAPDVMRNVQAYSALAANGDRYVYALEAGSVKEFVVSTDGLSWSLVGDVPIKM
ncbi:MAG: hypothetical protein Q9216_001325 [Gyalolechia sp. 2 TL-2023]